MGLHPVEGDDRHRRRAVADQRGPGHGHHRRVAPGSTSSSLRRADRGPSRRSCARRCSGLLESQGVTHRRRAPAASRARTRSWSTRPTACVELDADIVLLSTGSRPRLPDWAPVDGDRVLTTRDAYPPPELPEHLIVVGSGVTGVEFVHMFSSFGCQVTLIVSRQQVLPAEGSRGGGRARGRLHPPRRAAATRGPGPIGIDVDDDGVTVRCDDGRVAAGQRTPCSPSARSRTPRGSVSTTAGVDARRRLRRGQPQLPVVGAAHLRGRRPVGQAAAVVGGRHAGSQDRRARDGPARRSAPPPRLREGGVGHLHGARDRRRGPGRGRRLRRRAARSG